MPALGGPCKSRPPLPSPEQVFVQWLLWLPLHADLRSAAQQPIIAIDRRGSRHPDAQYLRTLFVTLAGGDLRRPTASNL